MDMQESIGRASNHFVPTDQLSACTKTSLCHSWVLAKDVLGKPWAADLVIPWLVAYPVALLVRLSCALSFVQADKLHSVFR